MLYRKIELCLLIASWAMSCMALSPKGPEVVITDEMQHAIRNNKVRDTFRSAIAIESVDGAVIENIVVDSLGP